LGSKGLIKANIKAYFKARSKGLSENDALEVVINSRYPLSESNREEVRSEFKSALSKPPILDSSDPEKRKVKELVRVILFFEYPRAEDKYLFSQVSFNGSSFMQKIEYQIDSIYESMRTKYRF